MIVNDQVIFIHNPRAAGTSIRRALLHGDDPNDNISFPGSRSTRWTYNSKHMFASQARPQIKPEIWKRLFKFAVVRNPWDRIVSIYGLFRRPLEARFQVKQGERGLNKAGMPRWKINKRITAVDHEGIDIKMPTAGKWELNKWAMDLEFKDWLKFCIQYRWNAIAYVDQPHARKRQRAITQIPQSDWFDGLNHVYKFEELSLLYHDLANMGYPIPIQENETQHEPWETYYDDESYAIVAEAFSPDIKRFGY